MGQIHQFAIKNFEDFCQINDLSNDNWKKIQGIFPNAITYKLNNSVRRGFRHISTITQCK